MKSSRLTTNKSCSQGSCVRFVSLPPDLCLMVLALVCAMNAGQAAMARRGALPSHLVQGDGSDAKGDEAGHLPTSPLAATHHELHSSSMRALSTDMSFVRLQQGTSLNSISRTGTTEVAVLLLIPARLRDQIYVPVVLSATLIEFNPETRQKKTLEDRMINETFMPGLERSTIHLQFQVSMNAGTLEHSVQIVADSYPIWFSGWVRLHGQDRLALDVSLWWFKQAVHIYFPSVLHSSKPRAFPAYSAVVEVYESSLSQNWTVQDIADDNGTVVLYTIMNSTYTYSSHYPMSVTLSQQQRHEPTEKIVLIQRRTVRTRGPARLYLPIQFPLLCDPSTSFFELESLERTASFPASANTYVYRPRDACQWHFSMPSAGAIQAVVYMQRMSAASTLSFGTRRESLDNPDEHLTLFNSDPHMFSSTGISLKVSTHAFFMSLKAQGSAGYNPTIEWAALSTRTPFSWGFTVMVTACTFVCTCLAWAAWMLKAYMDHRRVMARERQFQFVIDPEIATDDAENFPSHFSGVAAVSVEHTLKAASAAELPLAKYGEDLAANSQDECCICLELFEIGDELNKLSCGHFFHKGCITSWLEGHNFCPLCKQVISYQAKSTCAVVQDTPNQDHAYEQNGGDSQAQHSHRMNGLRLEEAQSVGEQWQPPTASNPLDRGTVRSTSQTNPSLEDTLDQANPPEISEQSWHRITGTHSRDIAEETRQHMLRNVSIAGGRGSALLEEHNLLFGAPTQFNHASVDQHCDAAETVRTGSVVENQNDNSPDAASWPSRPKSTVLPPVASNGS